MDPDLDVREWVGREVEVCIDRPLGCHHPEHPDMLYGVNYGYIPGTLAPDGEQLDAYVLGPEEPVARCRGHVIAIIRRRNDIEDKLVVSTEGRFGEEEILKATLFQEQYFDSYVEGLEG